MEPKEVFAENLRAERATRSFSQEELADRCELHRTEISLIERGERDPRLATILRLARGLEVPVARLMRGIDAADLPVRAKDAGRRRRRV